MMSSYYNLFHCSDIFKHAILDYTYLIYICMDQYNAMVAMTKHCIMKAKCECDVLQDTSIHDVTSL